ncbi:pleckstrin y domain-containing protein [Schizosaccharomyces japonicus yFS275]|uniref:Pleckstrin y domain-containing protein n=1 Tax=Schizosaccharomyces japonicus (strain yFS275 / FY16936) TaxID=402676 RepID=B6K3Q6_SCHJY|nr:pleckstrin y domain-containing protein [Schizosaccharomyces japonicus yFS275]EEB08113.2 pleckstrin y domain-containing protein [Schizosaccharomyces japonicus yFS275]
MKDHKWQEIPILLNECSIDSPSFRASVQFLSSQAINLQSWLDEYLSLLTTCVDTVRGLEKIVSTISSHHVSEVPSFSLFDSDYTSLAIFTTQEMLRSTYLVDLEQAKHLELYIISPLELFRDDKLVPLIQLINKFREMQETYDSAIFRYAAQTKKKSNERNSTESQQLREARSNYFNVAAQCSDALTDFRTLLDTVIIDSMCKFCSETYKSAEVLHSSNDSKIPLVKKMLSYNQRLRDAYPNFREVMLKMQLHFEEEIMERLRTSSRYDPTFVNHEYLKNITASHKQGWLLWNTSASRSGAKSNWVRFWFYVSEGMFGYLINDANGGVYESERYGVLYCKVAPVNSGRRFCFTVKSRGATFLLQAETQTEMLEWICVFRNSYDYYLRHRKLLDESIHNGSTRFMIKSQLLYSQSLGSKFANTGTSSRRDSRVFPNVPGRILCGPANYELSNIVRLRSNSVGRNSFLSGSLETRGPQRSLSFSHIRRSDLLAPDTFGTTPLVTKLTSKVLTYLLEPGVAIESRIPSAVLANIWGSTKYGFVHVPQTVPPVVQRLTVLDGKAMKEVDSLLTPELKLRNAEFRALYCDVNAPIVLFVCRICSKRDDKTRLPGRMYCTMQGIYVYYYYAGLVTTEFFPVQDIVSVKTFPGQSCDYFYLKVHDVGTLRFSTYIDSAQLLTERVNLLLQNYISDNPTNIQGLLRKLKTLSLIQRPTLPVAPKQISLHTQQPSPNSPLVPHHLQRSDTLCTISDFYKSPVPQGTVDVSRSSHLSEIVLENTYDVSAKALFHIMFGDQSSLMQKLYGTFNVHDMEFMPWVVDPKTKGMERKITFKLFHFDAHGGCHTEHFEDFQNIEERREQQLYLVVWHHRSWTLPFHDQFLMRIKTSINHYRKNSCKLIISADVEWKHRPFALWKVIESAARDISLGYTSAALELVNEEVEKAKQMPLTMIVRTFGRVGEYRDSQTVQRNEENPFSVCVHGSAELIMSNFVMFLDGFMMDLMQLPVTGFKRLLNYVFSHAFVLTILSLSLLINQLFFLRLGSQYWEHKRELRTKTMLKNFYNKDIRSVDYVYLKDIDDLILPSAHNQSAFVSSQPQKMFCSVSSIPKEQYTIQRREIARVRRDLLYKLIMLNYKEYVLYESALEDFLVDELNSCQDTIDSGLATPDIVQYCAACFQEWSEKTILFGRNSRIQEIFSSFNRTDSCT